jgi:hypothetical protein
MYNRSRRNTNKKNCRCRGQAFPTVLGIRKYAEVKGVYGVCIVYCCAVRGRGDDGVFVGLGFGRPRAAFYK